jgi:hypothetical protein
MCWLPSLSVRRWSLIPAFRIRPPSQYGVPRIVREDTVRSRLFALGAAAVLTVAGCTEDKPAPVAARPVEVVAQPAASAGGACILWDYRFIQEKIGVAFSVAASDTVDETSSCVVRTEAAEAPFLVLTVVATTTADAELFTATLMPDRATRVKGLGKAGYRLVGKPKGTTGPTVEVGWLSEAEQLQSLKFTFPKDATDDAVADMSNRLVDLAKAMDTTDGEPGPE